MKLGQSEGKIFFLGRENFDWIWFSDLRLIDEINEKYFFNKELKKTSIAETINPFLCHIYVYVAFFLF